MRISKSFAFEAAHRLQGHDGQCKNLHGHSYKVEVEVEATIVHIDGPQEGMVLDFHELKEWWESAMKPRLDHVTILQHNDPLRERIQDLTRVTVMPNPPTAEWLADLLQEYLIKWLKETPHPYPLQVRATVFETATSSARTYWHEVE